MWGVGALNGDRGNGGDLYTVDAFACDEPYPCKERLLRTDRGDTTNAERDFTFAQGVGHERAVRLIKMR